MFWEPTRQLAALAIRGESQLSLEAVRNEWATRRIKITGPAPTDLGPRGPGSSAAARIVDCNPRHAELVDVVGAVGVMEVRLAPWCQSRMTEGGIVPPHSVLAAGMALGSL